LTYSVENLSLSPSVKMPFRELKYISIPKGLPSAIINDNKLLKSVCILFKLKSLYKSGVIKNYTRRYSEISKHPNINCSESKLRNYISILREYGYVRKDKNKNLHLVSKSKLRSEFEVSKFSYKISKDQICNLEDMLKALVLAENLQQQKNNVIDKIIFDEYSIGKEKGSRPSKALNKIKKFVEHDFNSCLSRQQARYAHTVKNDLQSDTPDFFPFITLSRNGIARKLNRKSKSCGYRYAQKFKKLGYIESDVPNYVIIESNVTYDYFRKFKAMFNFSEFVPYLKYSRGRILRVLPNNLQMTLISKF
jgi:hypothetical protein